MDEERHVDGNRSRKFEREKDGEEREKEEKRKRKKRREKLKQPFESAFLHEWFDWLSTP